MHEHVEIIMPPIPMEHDRMKDYISRLLGQDAETEEDDRPDWLDYFLIGGRWSGAKLKARVGQDKINAFCDELIARKFTVSSVSAGKQELSPDSQIPIVDELWRTMCPGHGDVCPILKHYERTGDHTRREQADICTIADIPAELTAGRVILACEEQNKYRRINGMLVTEIWNGATWQETKFSGNVIEAVKFFEEKIGKPIPADWIVVTVDIHN